MAGVVPTALILGHSFVKRLKRDLEAAFDPRAARDFNLFGAASVCMGLAGTQFLRFRRMTFTWSGILLQILLSWK